MNSESRPAGTPGPGRPATHGSDYVARLRAELLRAGAAQAPRRRRAVVHRGLLVPVAVALLVATVLLTVPGERRDDVPAQPARDAVTLTYRLPAGAVTEAAQVMRDRLSGAGISADVVARDDRTLAITAPRAARSAVAALTVPGRFAIYDWERSVLGGDGRPAPTDPAVTGGPGGGQQGALTEAEARARAEKRPGAQVLQSESGWFAVAGDPALTNTDVASARADQDPAGDRIVVLDLTPAGQQAFTTLTRELAHRGAAQSFGGDPLQTSQHLALVLDDRIVSVPFINWREAPEGIDGADGAQLSGRLTPEQSRLTAAVLDAGPLPAELRPSP